MREQMLKQPILLHAICLGVVLTILGGAGAITFQQMLRRGANQPQQQMAEFYTSEISSGQNPDDSIPSGYVDLGQSLEPFLIFYDDEGKAGKATGFLDQTPPTPPPGVFNYARLHGSDTLTWQPRAHVRIAAVIQRVKGTHPGFLLAGRSLRAVEEDETILSQMTIAGWFAVMLLLASGAAFLSRFRQVRQPTP